MHSSQQSHHYMTGTTSIVTSNQVISRSKLMMITLPYFSLTLVWHSNSAILQLIYTSINGQQGHTQSCRNDLESLAYTIIFLACGNLPWTTDSIYNNREAVLWKKMLIMAEELCEGLPPPFSKFVSYVRSLGFDEKPDYKHLHTILLRCSETNWLGEALPSSFPPSLKTNCTPVSSDRV